MKQINRFAMQNDVVTPVAIAVNQLAPQSVTDQKWLTENASKTTSSLFLIYCVIFSLSVVCLFSCIGVMQIEVPPAASTSTPNIPSTVSSPVTFKINWTNDLQGNYVVTLDGADISNQFTASTSRAAVSSPQTLASGLHKLVAAGNLKSSDGTFHNTSSIRDFNVAAAPPVFIAPIITSITPDFGPTLTTIIRIEGTNLMSPPGRTVITIGGITATQNSSGTATQLVCTVPGNLIGMVPVIVESRAGLQRSNAVMFDVTARSPAPLIMRSTSTDLQSFDFAVPGSPSMIIPSQSNLRPGNSRLSVALATDAMSTVLVRSSTQNLEAFTINPAGQVSNQISAVSATATSVGTGVFINSSGTQVVRSSDKNIQVFGLSGASISALPLGTSPTAGANAASTAVNGNAVQPALVGGKSLAVRTCDNGIEVFDISIPNAITLFGKFTTGGLASAPGAGISVIGSIVVRAYSGGVEVYSLPSTPSAPLKMGSNTTGHLSATGVDVVTNGTFIIRATDIGIEVYNFISTLGPIAKIDAKNGVPSSTGVAVTMIGSRVFRAYAGGIEEYDINSGGGITLFANNIIAPPATLGATGVGIAIRR
jgi:hypothetical protein